MCSVFTFCRLLYDLLWIPQVGYCVFGVCCCEIVRVIYFVLHLNDLCSLVLQVTMRYGVWITGG